MSELPDSPLGLDLHDLDTSIGIVFEGYVITTILYGFIFFGEFNLPSSGNPGDLCSPRGIHLLRAICEGFFWMEINGL
jgi:hypothetical protein